MSVRAKCERDGHKFREIAGVPMPYIFCKRFGCDGCAVSRDCPPSIAVMLHNTIPWEDRFPQVELDTNGEPMSESKKP